MPGWLWVVIAVVLAVLIYVLLRNRGGGGRHRTAGAEYAPALDDGASRVDAETGFGPAATAGLDGAAAAPVVVADDDEDDRRWAPTREVEREEERETSEVAEQEAREEEQAEDAELRHDEGYVETLDDPVPAAASEPAPAPEPELEPEPEPEPTPATAVGQSQAAAPSPEHGAGTVAPSTGATGPQGWTVKGNADSMLYYTADAPGFNRAAADVWFEDEEAATKAGFTRWDAHHR